MRLGVRCEYGLLRVRHGGLRGITLPRGLSRVRVEANRCEVVFVKGQSLEVEIGSVSELCHIPTETLGKHRHLRGDVDAHRCCGSR